MPAPTPRPIEGTKIYQGDAATARLWELCGVHPGAFANAAQRGSDASRSLLPVHPRTYPGQVMWAETTAALRMQLLDLQQNWQIGNEGNYETVYSPSHKLAVAVVGGDINTGVRMFDDPKARRPRGPMTIQRVSKNRLQLALDLEGIVVPEDVPETDLVTWFFLLNARDGVLYSELSSPVNVGDDRRISDWSERIIFEPAPTEGAVTPTPILPDEGPNQPPVVHVDRKS